MDAADRSAKGNSSSSIDCFSDPDAWIEESTQKRKGVLGRCLSSENTFEKELILSVQTKIS